MAIKKPDYYSQWKFWPMSTADREAAVSLRAAFLDAVRASDRPGAADDLVIEFRRASVKLTAQERADGVYHRYRDGRPFTRVRVAVINETPDSARIIHRLITNMRCDKTIKVNPFGVEFDTREKIDGDLKRQMIAALTPFRGR